MEEMDEMRAAYYKELAGYKTSSKLNMKTELANYLRKSDEIQVTLFDSLAGLNAETTHIVNEKITDIKDQSNYKIMKLAQNCDKLQEKLFSYNKTDKNLRAILSYSITEIMKVLPVLEPSVEECFNHFSKAYDEFQLGIVI